MFRIDHDMCRQERQLHQRLEAEYTPELLQTILLPLVTQTSLVSLRVLDWAVVNWSKCHNVICSAPQTGDTVNMHQSYRRTLSYWKRRLFDPFRRRQRVAVRIGDSWYETTLGQANFALWGYKTGTLSYVLCHMAEIEEHMNRLSRRHKRERRAAHRAGVRKKRVELTKAPPSGCVSYIAPTRVTFS